MAGNGDFKWYWADAEDSERWYGSEDSREAAIASGRAKFGHEEFWICEADKSVLVANFNSELFAENIMDDLIEHNEECFDEDFDGDVWPNKSAAYELSGRLEKAVEDWLKDFPPKTWTFGDTRSVERIEALTDA